MCLYWRKKEIRVENKLRTKSSVRTFPLIPHIERMLLERKRQEEMFSEQLGSEFDREYDGFVCTVCRKFTADELCRVSEGHAEIRLEGRSA